MLSSSLAGRYYSAMVAINPRIYEALLREWEETTDPEYEDCLDRWLQLIEQMLDESGDRVSLPL